MRVTSELWVSALLRRAQSEGAFVTIAKKGAASAGAIFVILRGAGDQLTLIGPAPQMLYEQIRVDERQFEVLMSTSQENEILEKLDRERSFDPDLWIVEIEDRDMRSFIDNVVAS